MTFIPTRAAGLAKLADFVDRAGPEYAATRNVDHGPANRSNVSLLSPYLRYRLITEDEVVAAVRARHAGTAADKFVQEVLWRSYWKGWLELRPSVWTDFVADVARLEHETGGWRRDYDKALAGRTGIDCFDVWIGELAEHGYLHNHARMWFASIWIFTLRLPWQLGAALFWHHLYDGDPASNTLSWRWVAGLQTAGKIYLAQADNIARYTGGRFDPRGLATSATPISGPPPLVPIDPQPSDPLPSGRVGLLIVEDDLVPETLALGTVDLVAVASLGRDGQRAPCVERFIDRALGDARFRAGERYGVMADAIDDPAPAAVLEWATRHRLDALVIAYPPAGPGRVAFAAIDDVLQIHGLGVCRVRRPWDARSWPHAKRGYFAFRERFIA